MAGKGTDFGQFLHRLVATGLHGEVSDATIQGYLRAASQLEEVWQQIDERVEALIVQGMAPWEAYSRMGYALAFVRACRMEVICVQELLRAAGGADAATGAYLPRITYDQALALCEQIEPLLEEAILALTHPQYRPTHFKLPVPFGPHVDPGYQPFPVSHLLGVLGAAREMKEWAAGLLAKYELALGAAKLSIPPNITTHLETLRSKLRLGDFHLQTGADMVSHVSQGQSVADKLGKEGETLLWEAMESFSLVSQMVAAPGAPAQPVHAQPGVMNHPQPSGVPASPAAPAAPVHPAPVVPDLLSQLHLTTPATASAPQAPDLLNQLNLVNPPPPPPQPVPGDQSQSKRQEGRKKPAEPSANELLSELFGEQLDNK